MAKGNQSGDPALVAFQDQVNRVMPLFGRFPFCMGAARAVFPHFLPHFIPLIPGYMKEGYFIGYLNRIRCYIPGFHIVLFHNEMDPVPGVVLISFI